MLFNSIELAIILPIVFLLYWFVFGRNYRLQNLFVVIASYVFYGWWDWRFVFLVAFTSFCSWGCGRFIAKYRVSENVAYASRTKIVNITNVCINLLILGVFKYYDFFAQSFADLFMGGRSDGLLLNLFLPTGISFYTFKAIGYTIDVYKGRIEPTKDIVQFFAYISFFPQLLAEFKQEGIEVVLVFSPLYSGAIEKRANNEDWREYFGSLAKNKYCFYLDYLDNPICKDTANSCVSVHLNETTTKKVFTTMFCEDLKSFNIL